VCRPGLASSPFRPGAGSGGFREVLASCVLAGAVAVGVSPDSSKTLAPDAAGSFLFVSILESKNPLGTMDAPFTASEKSDVTLASVRRTALRKAVNQGTLGCIATTTLKGRPMGKADNDNRSNQLNPNNDAYHSSRAGSCGDDSGSYAPWPALASGPPQNASPGSIFYRKPNSYDRFGEMGSFLMKIDECLKQVAEKKSALRAAVSADDEELAGRMRRAISHLEARVGRANRELRSFLRSHSAELEIYISGMGYFVDDNFDLVKKK
jgi:hypothetical protein